jgi:hypothetical protein
LVTDLHPEQNPSVAEVNLLDRAVKHDQVFSRLRAPLSSAGAISCSAFLCRWSVNFREPPAIARSNTFDHALSM